MARATIACQTSVLIAHAKMAYELTLSGTMGQWPMVNAIDSYLESLHCVRTQSQIAYPQPAVQITKFR